MLSDNETAICYRLNGFADISLSARNAAAFIKPLCLVPRLKGGNEKRVSVSHIKKYESRKNL
jgi:hypothetical protein